MSVKIKAVYEQAKTRNPLRWSDRVRNWQHIKEVNINPDSSVQENRKAVYKIEKMVTTILQNTDAVLR